VDTAGIGPSGADRIPSVNLEDLQPVFRRLPGLI
jgi:hypothetical protein